MVKSGALLGLKSLSVPTQIHEPWQRESDWELMIGRLRLCTIHCQEPSDESTQMNRPRMNRPQMNQPQMNRQETGKRTILAGVLALIFLLAMVMGCGPGIYLVNPDPADPHVTVAIFGVPIIYAWAVFWFAVQGGVILAAYCWIWEQE